MSAVVSDSLPVYRPMHQSDLPTVLAVEADAYEYPWTEGIFVDCMRVGYYCVVCEIEGELVGHGVMSLGVGECHLLNICIHPDHQQKGLGTCMINYLLDVARWKKVKIAFLEVRVSNLGAHKLYTNLGFTEIGLRKNYYPGSRDREDALILTLELKPKGESYNEQLD